MELIEAAKIGDVAEVRRLLDSGVNILSRDQINDTALHWSCFEGYLEVTKLLLQRGVDVNVVGSNRRTPLFDSCDNGHLSVIKLLLEQGADVNVVDNDGWTPLHRRCHNRNRDIIRLLLDYRADTTLLDNDGRTALSYLHPHHREDIEAYIQELEQQRELERLYAMVVLEQQRSPYFAVADIGSIVTAFLR